MRRIETQNSDNVYITEIPAGLTSLNCELESDILLIKFTLYTKLSIMYFHFLIK